MDPIDPYDEMDEEVRKAFAKKDARIKELEYQVKQLEKYVTKGVTFRDELQARIKEHESLAQERQVEIERLMGAFNIDREDVGRIMHESWARTKRAQGFHHPSEEHVEYKDGVESGKWGAWKRNGGLPCHKCNYDLIPWETLSEKQKDIKRHAFDAVLAELRRRAGVGE